MHVILFNLAILFVLFYGVKFCVEMYHGAKAAKKRRNDDPWYNPSLRRPGGSGYQPPTSQKRL